jgi:RNA polymerase Rpb1, domain 1
LRFPSPFASEYLPATPREVHSWSFGQVRARRSPNTLDWQSQRGTLDDQAIFGTRKDLECACGKYIGAKHRNMVCDTCGVKVTTPIVRRARFGHVDLMVPVPHPFSDCREMLSALPILPAVFLESYAGRAIAGLYEELIDLESPHCIEEAGRVIERLFSLLLPAARISLEWGLDEAELFTRGLALVHRDSRG